MAFDRGKLERLALELENDGKLHKLFQENSEGCRDARGYREDIYDALPRRRDSQSTCADERKILHRHLAWKWGIQCDLSPVPEGYADLYPNSAYDNCTGSTCQEVVLKVPVQGLLDDLEESIRYGMQNATSALSRVDAALSQPTGQSQPMPELGATQESLMNAINIKTITTVSTDAKENGAKTLVNGVDIKTLGTNQVYALISDSESLIETLSKIKNKPLHLQAEIDAHQAGIDALVAHLNERFLAENPDAVVAKPAAKRRAPTKVEPKPQEGATPAA